MSCRVVNSLLSSRRETATIRYLFFSSLIPHRTRGIIREKNIGRDFHHTILIHHHIPNNSNTTFPCILPATRNKRFYGNTFTCSISNNTSSDISSLGSENKKINDDAIDKSQQRDLQKDGEEGDLIPPLKKLRNRIDEMTLSRKSDRKSYYDTSDEATNCLRQMFRWYGDKVQVSDCNKVIGILSTSKKREAPEKAFDILKHMIGVYEKGGNKPIRPDVVTYTSVIDAFAQKGDIDGSRKVFDMQVHDFETKDNLKAKPDIITFQKMIYACSQSRAKNAPEIAVDLLTTAIDWHKKGKLKDGPKAGIYITVMNACARNGDVDRATSILQMMENDVKNIPHNRVYSILINAWSKSGHPDAPQQAKNILIRLSIMFTNGISEEGPNTITYTSVMDTYAAQGDIQGAYDILELMEDDFKSGNKDAKPDTISYGTLINAISKSNKEDAPRQAMNILKKMIDLFKKGTLEEGPNTIIYSSVMNTYAAHGDIKGATATLDLMEADFNSGNIDAKPDMRTYSTLINVISKSGNKDAPRQATNILKKMVELHSQGDLDEGPNAITYTSVMDTFAVEGDIEGATNILKIMKDDFHSGNKNARPNDLTYNVLINAISKSGNGDAPRHAKLVLKKMINLYSKGEIENGPNFITYSSVMDAFAAHGDGEGASDIFKMLKNDASKKNTKPTLTTYNILINAWSKSNSDNAPDKVENILKEMNRLYKSGDLEEGPDDIAYTSMIQCLQKFKGTEQRIRELKRLMKSYKKAHII